MCSKRILGFGKPAVNLVQERNSEPFGILGLEEEHGLQETICLF